MAAGNGDIEVPPTLKALLATRLDQLDEPSGRCSSAAPSRARSSTAAPYRRWPRGGDAGDDRLAALVRRQLIRPDRAQLPGEDGFRFHHLLIRDAAYDALPKAVRAELHQRFAGWLDHTGSRSSSSTRSSATTSNRQPATSPSSGNPTPPWPSGQRSGSPPPVGARKARLDGRAALALLARAVELLRPHRLELALELDAAWAAEQVDSRAAVQAADTVAERAEAAGDRSGALLARAMALYLRVINGELGSSDEQEALCRAALPLEEERADPRRLALLWWSLIAYSANWRMRNDESVAAFQRALRYFRLAGDSSSFVTQELDWSLILSPRPADQGLQMLDAARTRPPSRETVTSLGRCCSRCSACFDEAWPLAEARSDHLREVTGAVMADADLATISSLEGDRQCLPAFHRL